MTVRQNAESFKQSIGTVLGLYEAYKDYTPTGSTSPNPVQGITEVLNALPDSTLGQLNFLGSTTASISTAIVSLGVVLAKHFPAVDAR
jgi:hypothetical protein